MTDEEKLAEERRKKAELQRKWRATNPGREAEYKRKWRAANRDKVSEQNRRYHSANKDKQAERQRKYAYGITKDQFDTMLAAQNASCAICSAGTPGHNASFHVDHCHTTGAVRGLLCHHCNTGLGLFKDSREALLRAANYLKEEHMKQYTNELPNQGA